MLRREDLPMLCELMEKTQASIDGSNSRRLYYALAQEALSQEQVVIVVSEQEQRLLGYVLAIIDRNSYWRSFLLQHPILGLNIMAHKLSSRIVGYRKKKPSEVEKYGLAEKISMAHSGRNWTESSPEVAKIIHIGVSNNYRCRGIAKELYDYLFKLLAKRGLKRVDANISLDNVSSISLHLSMGWRIKRANNNLFATIDIN